MAYPSNLRPTRQPAIRKQSGSSPAEWRCSDCGKLLGKRHGALLHISVHRGHDYRVNPPAEAVCSGCGTVNRI